MRPTLFHGRSHGRLLADNPHVPFYVAGFADVDATDAAGLISYLDLCTRISVERKRAGYRDQGIAPGMHVLDAGCGTGDDLRAIAELVGPLGRAVGVDASRAMIAEARKRGLPSNAQALQASADALPFPDATFDVCRADRLFQHLPAPDAAARELRRVLKPGGNLMLLDQDWETVEIRGGDPALTAAIVGAFAAALANGSAGRHHRSLLERAGFCDVRVTASATRAPFATAYALMLSSAVECAKAAGVIDSDGGNAWISTLLAANRRGEFSYGVTISVAHGSTPARSASWHLGSRRASPSPTPRPRA